MSFSSKKTSPTNIDLDSSQTLDNKTLTGSTIIEDGATITTPDIIDPDRLDVKKDTQANLETYALTATNGQMCFATDTKQMYQVVDNALAPVGGGSGGLDTFYTENFEGAVKAANFGSGNNAAFNGGGTLDGVLSDETVNPISKTSSLKYTMGASSTNDYIASPAITIDEKQKSQLVGLNLYFTYDGNDDDIKVVAYDSSNSVVLTSELVLLKSSTKAQRFAAQFTVPSNCTELKYGFQVVTGNSGAILVVDDVELTLDPLAVADLGNRSVVYGAGNGGTSITADFTDMDFTEIYDSNSAWDGTTYTVQNGDSSIIIDVGAYFTTSLQRYLNLYINGTKIRRFSDRGDDATFYGTVIVNKDEINTGDSISIRAEINGGSLNNNGTFHYINIVETWDTEQALTYNSRNAKNSMIRLHTGNGHGSTNNKIRRFSTVVDNLGSAITYADSATDGASFTIEEDGVYFMSFTDNISGQAAFGLSLNSTELTTAIQDIDADDRLSFAYTAASNRAAECSWSGVLTEGDIIRAHTNGTAGTSVSRIQFTITKIGVNDLLGVPVPQTAYIKDVKPSGTAGGTSLVNNVQTRDLTTVEGDTSIVSLSSNQFTLAAGKYEIEASAPCYKGDVHQIFLYNDTDSTYDIDGSSARAGTGDATQTDALLTGTIEITESKTFEIVHWTNTARGTDGLGRLTDNLTNNPATSNTYTVVRITKVP